MGFKMAVVTDGGPFSQVLLVYVLDSSIRAACRISVFKINCQWAVKFPTTFIFIVLNYLLPFFPKNGCQSYQILGYVRNQPVTVHWKIYDKNLRLEVETGLKHKARRDSVPGRNYKTILFVPDERYGETQPRPGGESSAPVQRCRAASKFATVHETELCSRLQAACKTVVGSEPR